MDSVKPSVDKAWLKNYKPGQIDFRFSEETLYQSVSHVDDPSRIAFRYFGMPFSYSRFYQMVDQAARAFVSEGLVKGDRVMLMLPTLPETLVSVYALNRLGVVIDFIDVRYTPDRLLEVARRIRPKYLFVMTFYLKQLETVRQELPVDRIVLMRGCDSMPSSVLFWYKFGEYFNGRRRIVSRCQKYIFWSELVKRGQDCALPEVDVDSEAISCIFQTSGTSGFPKSMGHTNFNMVNSAISKYHFLNNPQPGDRLLSMLPPFSMFGFVFNIHMPLMFGMTLEIVPLFVPEKMSEILLRRKPNHILCVPSQWNCMINNPLKDRDLSFLKTVYVAGESLNQSLRIKVNEIFASNGSQAVLQSDYGMTEAGGTIAFMHYEEAGNYSHQEGWTGYPMPKTGVCIYDNDNGEELGYGEIGEVCALPPFGIKEYMDNPESTSELISMHADGQLWFHTGDNGFIAPDGSLHVIGRRKRMIVRFDGTKIFPIEIETEINMIEGVAECSVVPMADPVNEHCQLPCAFIVAKAGIDTGSLKNEIREKCKKNLPVYLQPEDIRFVGEIPRNSAGKTDYRKLIELLH